MKKLFIASVLFGFTFSGSAQAQNMSFVATCKAFNQYLGTNGDVFDDDAVGQCDLNITHNESGTYFNVWFSADGESVFLDKQHNFGNELDFTIGNFGSIGDVGYNVGVALYLVPDAPGAEFGDIIDIYGELNHSFTVDEITFTPYVKAHQYVATANNTPESGQMFRIGSRYSVPVADSVTASGQVEFFHDTGAFGYEKAQLFDASFVLTKRFANGLSVGGVVKYYTPLERLNDGRESDVAYGFIISKAL